MSVSTTGEEGPLDIYCIHLPHRTDRMAHIDSIRAKYPSIRIHMVDAIQDSDGARGCLRSHQKVVADAKTRALPFVIVIEDDCEFLLPNDQLVDSLRTSISYLSKADIVNGCGNLPILTATLVDSLKGVKFLKAPDVRTAHCILYGATSYDKILSLSDDTIIDIETNALNMVFTYPYLATQLPSYSDICKIDVFYDNIERSRAFVQNILEGSPLRKTVNESVNPFTVLRIPIWANRV